mmetsp:Transcript_955/g.3585  ORF Transcript_955/g.3585 Transcript_955/m.3585 type:complete len:200 (-) Transcript_955:988-1587(-)
MVVAEAVTGGEVERAASFAIISRVAGINENRAAVSAIGSRQLVRLADLQQDGASLPLRRFARHNQKISTVTLRRVASVDKDGAADTFSARIGGADMHVTARGACAKTGGDVDATAACCSCIPSNKRRVSAIVEDLVHAPTLARSYGNVATVSTVDGIVARASPRGDVNVAANHAGVMSDTCPNVHIATVATTRVGRRRH